MLKDLCHLAHECLLEYLRTTLDLPEGLSGLVMAIHTFGEYPPSRFACYGGTSLAPTCLPRRSPKGEDGHALVADGLFARSGLFYVLPEVSLKPLEDLFRARVIAFLVDKGLLP